MNSLWLVVLNAFTDICFFIDIPVTFRTSVIDEKGEDTTDPKKIAKIYLRGQFTIDFLSVVPLDLFGMILIKGNSAEKLKLMAILKLARLLRINRIISMLMIHKGAKVKLKLANLMFYLFLYCHLWACYWFYFIKGSAEWIHPLDTIWGDRDRYANNFYNDRPVVYQYFLCLYTAIQLLLSNDLLAANTR